MSDRALERAFREAERNGQTQQLLLRLLERWEPRCVCSDPRVGDVIRFRGKQSGEGDYEVTAVREGNVGLKLPSGSQVDFFNGAWGEMVRRMVGVVHRAEPALVHAPDLSGLPKPDLGGSPKQARDSKGKKVKKQRTGPLSRYYEPLPFGPDDFGAATKAPTT